MVEGSCHCGAIKLQIDVAPDEVTDCNCSICRRYGVLWAYYKASTVRVEAAPKAIRGYSWGRKALRFVRCATCGCVMCWERVSPKPERKMGVNARNFEPKVLRSVRVIPLDGASF